MKNTERKNYFMIASLILFIISASVMFYILINNLDSKPKAFNAVNNNQSDHSYEDFGNQGVSENYNNDEFETKIKWNITLSISTIIMIIMVIILNDTGRKLKKRAISENNQVYMFQANYFNVFKIVLLALYIISLYSIVRK